MIIALAIVAGATVAFLVFLITVILGTRQEPEQMELRSHAPNQFAGAARRMLGVYVGRPGDTDDNQTRNQPIACRGAGPEEDGDLR